MTKKKLLDFTTMFLFNQCEFKASWKGNLMRHIKSIHEGVRFPVIIYEGANFSCDQCEFKASWKGDLFRHIKSIHEGVRFPVIYVNSKQHGREMY